MTWEGWRNWKNKQHKTWKSQPCVFRNQAMRIDSSRRAKCRACLRARGSKGWWCFFKKGRERRKSNGFLLGMEFSTLPRRWPQQPARSRDAQTNLPLRHSEEQSPAKIQSTKLMLSMMEIHSAIHWCDIFRSLQNIAWFFDPLYKFTAAQSSDCLHTTWSAGVYFAKGNTGLMF